jgi:hypothetical protein
MVIVTKLNHISAAAEGCQLSLQAYLVSKCGHA